MHFPNKPKGVIFDMDGLLIDTIPLYVTAMLAASAAVGHPLSQPYICSLTGLLGQELRDRIVQDCGSAFPIEDFGQATAKHLAVLLDEGAPLKAGAAEILGYLSSLDIPLAVATSLDTNEAERYLGHLRQFFRAVVGRDGVQRSKPYPDVYLKAAALLQLQPPDCLALEDSFNGIKSAHAAGCMVIMVPDALMPIEEIKPLCLGSARDLPYVQALLQRLIEDSGRDWRGLSV